MGFKVNTIFDFLPFGHIVFISIYIPIISFYVQKVSSDPVTLVDTSSCDGLPEGVFKSWTLVDASSGNGLPAEEQKEVNILFHLM